jgi:hypothetical protein
MIANAHATIDVVDTPPADRLVGMLRTHVQVREYEAGIGNDVTCVFDGLLRGRSTRSTTSYTTFGIESSSTSSSDIIDTPAVAGYEGSNARRALSSAGMDAESIARMSRCEISSRMRSRTPLRLCLLVGGLVRCGEHGTATAEEWSDATTNAERIATTAAAGGGGRVRKQISIGFAAYSVPVARDDDGKTVEEADSSDRRSSRSIPNDDDDDDGGDDDDGDDHRASTSNPHLAPKLFWLDQYGSLQDMRYGAHGYGSNFAYSILDRGYSDSMSRREAAALIRECFEQLRLRYVINSPRPPRIKCIDRYGVTEIIDSNDVEI